MIALTHVCKAWREIFISRSSLWTDLDCKDTDKTRVYLERSKSLPVSMWLTSDEDVHPCDPFFQIVTGRLGSLSVHVAQRYLPHVTAHLSRPAPLLQKLLINAPRAVNLQNTPVLTPALFGGDLSSLRDLRLSRVRTELQWRNMANLTTFVLARLRREISRSNNFLISLRALLASATSNSSTQPQPPVPKANGWCRWRA